MLMPIYSTLIKYEPEFFIGEIHSIIFECLSEFSVEMKTRSKPRIHIIDKNSAYRKVIEGLIRALGYNCITSSECCEQLLSSKYQPDIIILDHKLGEDNLSGLDFLRLYSSLRFPHTRFLFLSSCADIDIAVTSIRSGAYDYIIKSKKGLERLSKRLVMLVNAFHISHRKQKQLRAAIFSLGMFSLIFILVILLYNHQML